MTMTDDRSSQKQAFGADVARLLHMMVHSVYSDKSVFLRELVSNAADACEKLRYQAIAHPELLGDDASAMGIDITIDRARRTLTVADNGVGMTAEEMTEALGTIARSGTRAFVEGLQGDAGNPDKAQDAGEEAGEDAATGAGGAHLIGQFGVGFYAAFMVADQVDVISRKAGTDTAARWSSDGKGAFTVSPVDLADAPAHGARVVLHLMANADEWLDPANVRRHIREQSGHVPVPVTLHFTRPAPQDETAQDDAAEADAESTARPDEAVDEQIVDGSALWTRSRNDIKPEEYTDFYRSVGGMFDEPAMTIHYRAEGRHEFSALLFTPSSRPFDLLDPERKGRVKLYVKRVFITDDADILPRYLRFVRGVVDSADLPLNLSREMIQNSPVLRAISQNVTGRVLTELEKLAESDADAYAKVWENFGAVIKEGVHEDFARQERLLGLARFRTTASGDAWRSLKDYVANLRENQTAIYYITGDAAAKLENSPHLEGYRARGVEVLLLTDPVDSFWVMGAPGFEGKPFRSVTQGGADLDLIPLIDADARKGGDATPEVTAFISAVKETLGDAVTDVRASSRLTDSVVCLVAPGGGYDRHMERLLSGFGRLDQVTKPVLEINPHHALTEALAALPADDPEFRNDVAHLLLDEAAILDGGQVSDAGAFAGRLTRLLARAARN
ncbi:molecular chaperone HtpG [Camelimonas lactis]|uniref:Chaperone protein HtpG n=1 Tax=Camelimonas lactis TaxID=659006 RepID=A0A4R2GVG2_9HYPH|nr:molecular chaperone HtpG [Camelimonas lactis]